MEQTAARRLLSLALCGGRIDMHPVLTTSVLAIGAAAAATLVMAADPLPPDLTYRPLPTMPLSQARAMDEAQKPAVMQRQRALLDARYDLADRAMPGVTMSGGRKPVQDGVRVKLPEGQTWDGLAGMSPADIRERGLLPAGFLPLPHVKQATGGQVFPNVEIDAIAKLEGRDLRRFDVDLDLPDNLTPEFPPPIFLTTHPELGDVSRGQLLSIRNFYEIMNGIITPVQMEGLRLLLTPFPQEEFNQTEDRKVDLPSTGVACLDCHANFNTNAAIHQTPDVGRRPRASGSTPRACAACSTSRSTARSARCARSRTFPSSSSAPPISTAITSAPSARA
jgi:cytochrome c peroxidase